MWFHKEPEGTRQIESNTSVVESQITGETNSELFMYDPESGLIIFQDATGTHGMTPEAYARYTQAGSTPYDQ